MRNTKNCYKIYINKSFLLSKKLWEISKEIISNLSLNSKIGRPSLNTERILNGIFYVLKTGIQWKALPQCFGSKSAVHRFFQKLVNAEFFKKLWTKELEEYNKKHPLQLEKQAIDCSHKKSPLGGDKSGESPVDRRKLGSKLSVLSDARGIPIGLAVGSSNQHDSTLFIDTLRSVPQSIKLPKYKEMHLDSAYDSEIVKTVFFNFYYIPKIVPNQRNSKEKKHNPIGYSRWFIEPVHSWMNRFRGIFIRYSRLAFNYLALAQFASACIIFKNLI